MRVMGFVAAAGRVVSREAGGEGVRGERCQVIHFAEFQF